jgi:hypothetical protein
MKKSVLNLLRGGVFALAAVAAFAFTQPMPSFTTAWGDDPELGPVQVTIGNTSQYNCDEAVQTTCLFEDESLMNPIPSIVGRFDYVGPVPN